jgi:hypothetical protein
MIGGQALLTSLFATNLFGLGVVEREREGATVNRITSSYHAARLAAFVMGVGVWLPGVEVVRPLRLLSLAVMTGVVLMSVIHAQRKLLSEIGYRCLVDAVLVVSAWVLIVLAA